jgi:L-alanine-DL-glutamate epimerase-like enolase superfamily enzyme
MDAVGNMGILEDPFPRHFLDDYKLLRPRVNARLVVHIDPPESLWTVISSGAVGGLNIDSHAQGMWGWRSEAAAAEHANLPVWHGSSLDLGIATAAQLQLCASAPNCQLPGDQVGPWIRESHLLKSDFVVEKGCIRVPDGPGLGVEVDPAKLDKYTARAKQFKR